VIREHTRERAAGTTTKTIVTFPLDEEIPVAMVKRVVRASLYLMKSHSIPEVSESDDRLSATNSERPLGTHRACCPWQFTLDGKVAIGHGGLAG
jgi:hypothetical protein